MSFGWIAAATVASSLLGADAAQSAADTQAAAANRASDTNLAMFNKINDQASPFRQTGYDALANLKNLTGLSSPNGTPDVYGSQLLKPFTAADLKTNLAPNYDFMLGQGLGAARNQFNLNGGLGGNTLKGITDYAENYAGNAYQNAFSNYNANQTNIFNRLSAIAGLGQTANAQTATAGVPIAGAIGNAQQAAGAASAAGNVGVANAIGGGLTNAASWYTLPQILKGGSGGGGGIGGGIDA